MNTPQTLLTQFFNHREFRPSQLAIIESVLSGKDTLAILPTGGGKSICFQIPALMLPGICIVISPLIALMNDQVARLQEKKIAAASLHSGQTREEMEEIIQQAEDGELKLLYVSPERITSDLFLDSLPQMRVGLLAVDEAHCVSQWGYDFRPAYLRIAELRRYLPGVPLIALTASATPAVREDILLQLKMKEPSCFFNSFYRSNLQYHCQYTAATDAVLLDLLKENKGSAIIYCSSRKQTHHIAEWLQLHQISTAPYHAGLPQSERNKNQEEWISDQIRVMAATNAFGMGIDKPNVRLVIHLSAPECLEHYYQEAGRAGRDEQQARAVLLVLPDQIKRLELLTEQKFPEIEVIKKIYSDLAGFFQLPAGSGEGQSFEFDLPLFCSRFHHPPMRVMHVLDLLEREGHLRYSSSVYKPSQLVFTIEREQLRSLEESYPTHANLLQTLLRAYPGILHYRVKIYEQQLARLSGMQPAEVKQQLKELTHGGVVEYQPASESPQIHYLLNRAPAAHLYIDLDRYYNRKKAFAERLQAMINYLKQDNTCRSRKIQVYFGEKVDKDCEQCDVCLRRKKNMPKKEFSQQVEKIKTLLQTPQPMTILLAHFTVEEKEQVLDTLRQLLQEQIVGQNEAGLLYLCK